jgi:hypothetical protein
MDNGIEKMDKHLKLYGQNNAPYLIAAVLWLVETLKSLSKTQDEKETPNLSYFTKFEMRDGSQTPLNGFALENLMDELDLRSIFEND